MHESMLSAVLDALPACVAIVDDQSVIIKTNAAWVQFGDDNGLSASYSCVGVNYLTVCDQAKTPETQAVAKGLRAVLSGQQNQFEIDYLCPSPEQRRWFKLRVTPLHVIGAKRFMLWHENISFYKAEETRLMESVSQIKRTVSGLADSEQFLVKMINAVPSSLAYWDVDLRCRFINHPGVNWKEQHADNCLGKPWTRIVADPVPQYVQTHLNNVLAGRDQHFEQAFTDDNRKPRRVLVDYLADLDDQHRVRGFITLETDITELKLAEGAKNGFLIMLEHKNRELREKIALNQQTTADLEAALQERASLNEQLQRSQRLEVFGRLTAGIAHDFNNILAVIMGYTNLAQDMLQQPVDNSVTTTYLNQVDVASQRARDLIRKMMDYCRRDDDSVNDAAINPLHVIEESVELLQAVIGSKTTLRFRRNKVPWVALDPVDLNQIATNLIVNAHHAIESVGTITVTLDYLPFTAESHCLACGEAVAGAHAVPYVMLRVQDTGSGIAPENMSKICDAFFTTKEAGKGTGLGLSVLSGLVHTAGGHLLCESTVGQGTSFTVLLPPVAENLSVKSEPVAEIAASSPVGALTLLLVDDDIMVLGLLENQLRKLGHTVHASTLGRAALDEFKRQPDSFDAVITDYTMPEMDGIMLSNAILAVRPDMPIFLCSGIDLDTLTLPPQLTAIAKPIHFPHFIAALHQACSPVTDPS